MTPLNVCFQKMIVKMTSPLPLSFFSLIHNGDIEMSVFNFWGYRMSMDRNWGSLEGLRQ